MVRTIVFLNNKGGVGKTASVTTIGHMLAALHNQRVLIVDMDPQRNASNMFSRIDFVSLIKARVKNMDVREEISVGNLLINDNIDPGEAIRHTDYVNVDILPAFPTLAAVEEQLKADIKRPQQFRLKSQLDRVKESYDFILIDCAPSLSILNVNALVAADEVYIPTLPDDGSLFGIELTISELVDEVRRYSMQLKVGGMFFTRYKTNYNISNYAKELLETVYQDMLIPISIRENVAVSECSHYHMPLLAYDQKMRFAATRDYAKLTEHILQKGTTV